MKKLFFLPQYAKGQASNPYCENFIDSIKDSFDVLPKPQTRLPRGLELLLGSFNADIYILNWVESISFLSCGSLQAFMSLLAIRIIKFRKKRIVWIFHNIHPHEGENFWSKRTKKVLFRYSSMIITHSKEAANYAQKYSKSAVYYRPHPIQQKVFNVWPDTVRDCDFYIWGDIYPYKGIVEFVNEVVKKATPHQILIVGKATTDGIKQQLDRYMSSNIIFENRRPDYDEVAAQCQKAKYVLFPYIGNSISSSGILMDTLLMGGTPVGPNKGAFADLAEYGCCITYDSIDEVFNLPSKAISIDPNAIKSFVKNNSWEAFGKWFSGLI